MNWDFEETPITIRTEEGEHFMARSLMRHKPPTGPRKYSYKPEARVE